MELSIVLLSAILGLCGAQNIQPYILNGKYAEQGQFPYHARIYQGSCGGVLIDPEWVLTVRHCLPKTGNGSYPINVRMGGVQVKEKFPYEEFSKFWIAHPKTTGNFHDIGLIKIPRVPDNLSHLVRPVRLATPEMGLWEDQPATVCGFGKTNMEQGRLIWGDFQVTKQAVCKKIWNYLSDLEICAKNEENPSVHVHAGDSGGGLVAKAANGTQYVLGVLVGIANPKLKLPQIYTRVSTHYQWIREQMDSH